MSHESHKANSDKSEVYKNMQRSSIDTQTE